MSKPGKQQGRRLSDSMRDLASRFMWIADRQAKRLSRDPDTREELRQVGSLAIAEKLSALQDGSMASVDLLSRHATSAMRSAISKLLTQDLPSDYGVLDGLPDTGNASDIIDAISRLPDIQRATVTALFGLSGERPETIDQLSVRLGYTQRELKTALDSALSQLRVALSHHDQPSDS